MDKNSGRPLSDAGRSRGLPLDGGHETAAYPRETWVPQSGQKLTSTAVPQWEQNFAEELLRVDALEAALEGDPPGRRPPKPVRSLRGPPANPDRIARKR